MEEKFPSRVYTYKEVRLAKFLIDNGYRHRLRVIGGKAFKDKVKGALKLIRTAGYYDLLRTYIKQILEIRGFSQLREAEASIWANAYTVENPLEAASFFIQKAWQMKRYLEGKLYFGHVGETEAIDMRIKFLETLRDKSRDQAVKDRCEELLKLWDESRLL